MDKLRFVVGSEAYDSLLNSKISTLQKIVLTDIKILQDVTGVPLEIVNKAILVASEEIVKNKFQNAYDIEPWERISTGCKRVDLLLLGGVPTKGISEIYGCSGVGKTQFCLQLAINIQLGGKRKEIVYICTEDVFPSKRLNQLADAYRLKENVQINFEDHIYIRHIAESVQLQKCLLKDLQHFLSTKNVGLIIIDSIAGVFRSDNDNPSYVFRSHKLKLIAKALINLQDQYNCGILVVNQVTDNLLTGVAEPCLGLAWAHNVTCRFCLSRNTQSTRKFEIVFAPDLCPTSSNIIITPDGLTDV